MTTGKPRGCLRVVAINVILSLLGVGLVLGAAEMHARMTWTPKDYPAFARYRNDERLNHVFIPNFDDTHHAHPDIPAYRFRTNELGLRIGEPYPIEKPAATRRLIVCGDSFVEGYDFDKSVPVRVERLLSPTVEARGAKLHVVHAGIGTYSPMLHYFALREKLMQLDPDAVVLAVDQTDARDDFNYQSLLYEDENGEPAGVRSAMRGKLASLQRNMSVGLPWYNVDRWIAATAGRLHFSARTFERNALGYVDRYKSLNGVPDYDLTVTSAIFDARQPATRAWIEYSKTWVARFIRLLKARRIPVIIAMYPYEAQVRDPSLWEIMRMFEQLAIDEGVLFHDATPAFVAHGAPSSLYLSGDTHYNYAGQEVWAASLAAFLAEHIDRVLP